MITHRTAKIIFSIFAALFLTFAVAGQGNSQEPDPTMTPDAEMTAETDMEMTEESDMNADDDMSVDTTSGAVQVTLEDITGNASEYFGQRVSVEGAVEAFLNAKTFVLGEEAILDNDQLIVFNMTESGFDLRVSNETQVRVTGVILPSLEEREVNGINELDYWTPIYTPVDDSDMNFMLDPLMYFYNGELADDYDVYTVLVIEDVANVAVIPEENE